MPIEILKIDHLEYMSSCSNNKFELAHVDPPYGIGAYRPTIKTGLAKQSNFIHESWDDKPASAEFGREIFRVSEHQIIWGANHMEWIVGEIYKPPRRVDFKKFIEENPKGFILWDKCNGNSDQWDCEIAWTSFDIDSFIVVFVWFSCGLE